MTASELLSLRKREPFEPFRLVMADGTVHDVPRPELFLVGVESSHRTIPLAEDPQLADHFERLYNEWITHTLPLSAV